jgi:hypothetical protein
MLSRTKETRNAPEARMYRPGARQHLRARMARVHWIEDWTIINELLVMWLVLQPPLAVFWLLRERQLTRPDGDRPD